jgi:hypothetical protein
MLAEGATMAQIEPQFFVEFARLMFEEVVGRS